ncbi:MAG: L-threonylcarbamoyladenylate synthase [Cytophagales bacterium]|nr:L-threonylcarbamoyladenylate synthase [Cytophagales bacterium]MDW8383297.1 L-threonylcarbamoyladenylate synthase [Flammeovirgaceae bacterium]
MNTQIGKSVGEAVRLLRKGELIALPTETVYGLAGNGFVPEVVAKIFVVKNRPFFDPLILHTSSIDKIYSFVKEIPSPLQKLAEKFMPGALTLVLPRLSIVPDLVTNGLDTVAVRIPSHPLAQEVLQKLDFPLAAPSANPFGYISPTTAQHVYDNLKGKIPYILDGGTCNIGIESTIVGIENHKVTVFRKGGISLEQIQDVLKEHVVVRSYSSSNPKAPGMLLQHYAPRKPLKVGNLTELLQHYSTYKVGIMSFCQKIEKVPEEYQFILSSKADLQEATQRFFSGLRYLDAQNIDIILAEFLPEKGLGSAINDRLRRASC